MSHAASHVNVDFIVDFGISDSSRCHGCPSSLYHQPLYHCCPYASISAHVVNENDDNDNDDELSSPSPTLSPRPKQRRLETHPVSSLNLK